QRRIAEGRVAARTTGPLEGLTREAVEELGLEVGARAVARVKSTSVFIDRV
ncbi:TOBE domain-containing protein, partial [Streptomyces sp. NPDC001193]